MKFLAILSLVSFLQGEALITKNNGDEIRLSNVQFYQAEEVPSTKSVYFIYRGEKRSISINELKRINLKESLGKKKGISTWSALLITNENEKFEVSFDFIQLTGINEEGKEETYSSSIIDKISL